MKPRFVDTWKEQRSLDQARIGKFIMWSSSAAVVSKRRTLFLFIHSNSNKTNSTSCSRCVYWKLVKKNNKPVMKNFPEKQSVPLYYAVMLCAICLFFPPLHKAISEPSDKQTPIFRHGSSLHMYRNRSHASCKGNVKKIVQH